MTLNLETIDFRPTKEELTRTISVLLILQENGTITLAISGIPFSSKPGSGSQFSSFSFVLLLPNVLSVLLSSTHLALDVVQSRRL